MSRSRVVGWSGALLVATLLGGVLVGCGASGAQQEAARVFLDAWARGDLRAAAAATDAPGEAAMVLDRVDRSLGLAGGELATADVREENGLTTVTYTASWRLDGVVEPWRYDGRVAVAPSTNGDWRVRWQPQDVHPQLGPGGTFLRRRTLPPRAAILDASGQALVAPTPVVTVGIVPGRTPDVAALAGRLAAVLGIRAEDIVSDARTSTPDAFVPVITLRRPDYDAVADRVRDLPGTAFRERLQLLGPTSTFGQPLLGRVGTPDAEELRDVGPGFTADDEVGTSGLQAALNEPLAGRAETTIELTDPGTGPTTLARFPGGPGQPVTTTLDLRTQQAAETALAGVAPVAAIVALRPSTGAVLAVANSAAAPFDVALGGRYSPGSTFKIVTAAAALGAGTLRPDSPVGCPATTAVGGRVIPNADDFALGTVPFTDAFARSCNTTFAELAGRLPDGALDDAAVRFGIGAGWQLPVEAFDGSFTPGADPTARAANAFGQGTTLVSPLSEALMAAAVVRGTTPTPTLVPDRPTGVARAPAPLPDGVAAALAPMMRAVVTTGTATELAAVPGGPVAGKTGTAEHGQGDPPPAHSWFTGYQGDVAFTVFVTDGQTGGTPADPIAARFLTALAG
ncbi:penicillin-binding transpeptidase domain-containing protein [Actinomycetospora atypica]|uniref:Penicillin-binding transpeptidase domain-containing protein n=1 Tax=Actinomycetospora atypica TaxID=1290095 RepID=A0ABV9YUC7_9PSEU